MPFEWDPDKREGNLLKHGVDFLDAERVDWSTVVEQAVDRDGETRIVAYGLIESRVHVIVYTIRGVDKRIISMRKANPREAGRYVGER